MSETLDADEKRAIATLKRLSRSWPKTLTLASMGGDLFVLRSEYRDSMTDGSIEDEYIVAEIRNIPNTGGDW